MLFRPVPTPDQPCLVTPVLPLQAARVKQRGGGRRLLRSRSLPSIRECSGGARPKNRRPPPDQPTEAMAMRDAVARFAEDIISAKEEVECDRQLDKGGTPSGRWRISRVTLDRPYEKNIVLYLFYFGTRSAGDCSPTNSNPL